MNVKRSQLVKVFAAIGVPTAEEWSAKKLGDKVGKLAALRNPDQPIADSVTEGMYQELVDAAAAGQEIVVEDDAAAPAKKGGKKAGGKAGGKQAGKGSKATKPTAAKETKATKASANGSGGKGKPGVIATIVECLASASEENPVNRDAIQKKLVKAFPDRDPAKMENTMSTRVRANGLKSLGLTVKSNEKGSWLDSASKAKVRKKAEAAA